MQMKLVSIDCIVKIWIRNDTRYLAPASHEISPKRSKLFVKRHWRSVIDKLTIKKCVPLFFYRLSALVAHLCWVWDWSVTRTSLAIASLPQGMTSFVLLAARETRYICPPLDYHIAQQTLTNWSLFQSPKLFNNFCPEIKLDLRNFLIPK